MSSTGMTVGLALTGMGGAGILIAEVMLGGEPAVPCTRNPL